LSVCRYTFSWGIFFHIEVKNDKVRFENVVCAETKNEIEIDRKNKTANFIELSKIRLIISSIMKKGI